MWPPGGAVVGRHGLPGGTRDIRSHDVGRVPVQAAPGPVIPDRGPRISMRGSFLDVAQRHPRIERGGDERYLYLILKNAWQRPVLACEGREARKAEKMAAKKRCLVLVLSNVPHRVPDTCEARAG